MDDYDLGHSALDALLRDFDESAVLAFLGLPDDLSDRIFKIESAKRWELRDEFADHAARIIARHIVGAQIGQASRPPAHSKDRKP